MKRLGFGTLLLLMVGVACAAQGVESLSPTDDTYIDQYVPTGVNGARTNIAVRNQYGGSAIWELDGLFRFDLSGIPRGAILTTATLHVYYYAYRDSSPVGRNLTCHRITGTWSEAAVTWNTRPPYDSTATSGALVPSSYTWMTWDVTADVRAFVDRTLPNHGWQIMDLKKWGTANIPLMYFYSREYSTNQPHLDLTLPTHLGASGSTSPGGTLAFQLTAANDPGQPYQVGSALGAGPIPIDTREIGLGLDALLQVSLSGMLPGVFVNYAGRIDAQGTARASLAIPPSPGLVGIRIYTAFVTLAAAAPSGVGSVSNTFSFAIAK
ncbi:MAG: DNRLRE domain-containing protein [Planctomycetes bacterium]|nr:DNRLRE domain-containing protein [Planctomycetota bacterium]